MFRQVAFYLIVLAAFIQPAAARDFIAMESEGASTVITLAVGDVDSHKVFFLDNPSRMVVDVPMAGVPTVYVPNNYEGGHVGKVRAGRFNANTVRIVFELAGKATLVAKSLSDGLLTITIEGARSASAPKPKPQKPLVIIDAGHGGDDPGAIGPRGSQEKDIVLAFARSLEDALERTGRYRVKLTRSDDRFIPLRKRVDIGRKAKGSIFISIHADSAPGGDARGLSVYTLSEKASDAETEKLAANENKVDIIGGMDLSGEREDVADILISLAQRETRNQSALLADLLAASLGDNLRLLSNPHRFAGFAVLKAPDIPSVLVETGFISHPSEEKLLKTKEYRQKLVSGMIEGIDKYFAKQVVE